MSTFRRFTGPAMAALATLAVAALTIPQPASAQAAFASAEEEAVTYAGDVAAVLNENCVSCHREGGVAPMSLTTYEEVRPWARLIQLRTETRQMPPWHIDPNIGIQKFKGDISLSDEEIATLGDWVDSGAPMGDPAELPKSPEFATLEGWEIEDPDLVVEWEYDVPAVGPDHFGDIYSEPIELQEDRYIKAIESRAVDSNSRRVVHHALSYAQGPGTGGANEQFLVEYASGKRAEFYPDDAGVLLPAGTKVRLSYHMHPVGEEITAKFQLGIVLHPKGYEPTHRRWTKQLGQRSALIDLPPNQVTRTDGYVYFHENTKITAWQPHMHALGTYQCLELIYPTAGATAKTETVNCARWDYNWHTIYNYADDVAPIAPKGTVGHIISYFDNTAKNAGNHDPDNWTGDGPRTIDEMSFSWIGWVELTDEEYKAELQKREQSRKNVQEAMLDAAVNR
ncbi:MAG: cytochrome c [Gemmatimonadota bacterium]